MMQTVWGTVHEGQVQLLESVVLPEGAKVLVTVLTDDDERSFWYKAQQESIRAIWDNAEDDVYGELLQE